MRERARRFEENDGTHKGWHSSAYHRFFEGYSEYMVEDGRGKVRIRRVYTAPWYRMELETGTKRLLRAELLGCWAVCLLLFLYAGTRNILLNKVWYMALCQAAAAACMVWNFFGMVRLMFLPERSTVGQYRRSFETVKKSSLGLLTAFGGAALAALAQLLLGCDDFLIHLLCMALYGIGMVVSLVIHRLNANIPFAQVENTNDAGENASIID